MRTLWILYVLAIAAILFERVTGGIESPLYWFALPLMGWLGIGLARWRRR